MSSSKIYIALACLILFSASAEEPEYKPELNIVYCTVDGKEMKLNAFIPAKADKPTAAMVEIHGGWWSGGSPAKDCKGGNFEAYRRIGAAIFTTSYRLGKDGGFPQNIRDCRNAVRFIRKNAARFNIDPERIGVSGVSAGGHLSLMVAMVPEEFDDGGPTDDLKGVSAKVCNCFSYVGPTDFVQQWTESADARRYHAVLFRGVEPTTDEGKALYLKMSPIFHVRKDLPPLLICQGEKDPIVNHAHGSTLHEKLKAAGADSTYWLTAGGGHGFPGGPGFKKVLDDFLERTLGVAKSK